MTEMYKCNACNGTFEIEEVKAHIKEAHPGSSESLFSIFTKED
jgi:hypothetical protein